MLRFFRFAGSLSAHFLAAAVTATHLFAQGWPAGFPVDSFEAHAAVARWMAAYDRAAWMSTDAVQALPSSQREGLGAEWFCYQAAGRWHGVYGRYDPASDRYDAVVHLVQGDSGYRRVSEAPDTALARPFGRALHRAIARLPEGLRSRVSMNQFVRRLPGGQVEVWLIPGWQPAGHLLHGLEWRYTFDPEGRAVLDSSQSGKTARAFRPDTTATIVVEDHAFRVPRVASLFLLLTYGHWFRQLFVESQGFRSTLYRGPGPQAWIHVVRQATPPTAPK